MRVAIVVENGVVQDVFSTEDIDLTVEILDRDSMPEEFVERELKKFSYVIF